MNKEEIKKEYLNILRKLEKDFPNTDMTILWTKDWIYDYLIYPLIDSLEQPEEKDYNI